MKINLFYNPKAGKGKFDLKSTVAYLQEKGAEISAQNTKKSGYKKAIGQPCDFMVIAGGDGTVEKVIREMKAKEYSCPIAILPYGNANNIAHGLSADTDLSRLVKSWESGWSYPLSIGEVITGKNKYYFVESVGWGLFQELLQRKDHHKPKNGNDKVAHGKEAVCKELEALEPFYMDLSLDQKDHSGDYLWIEVMNSKRMGPALSLAADAVTHDRYLDVFLVKDHEDDKLRDYLKAHRDHSGLPPKTTIKAETVMIRTHHAFHIDDELSEEKAHEENKEVTVTIRLCEQSIPVVNARMPGN